MLYFGHAKTLSTQVAILYEAEVHSKGWSRQNNNKTWTMMCQTIQSKNLKIWRDISLASLGDVQAIRSHIIQVVPVMLQESQKIIYWQMTHHLRIVKTNLTNIHWRSFLQIIPRSINNINVVHFIACTNINRIQRKQLAWIARRRQKVSIQGSDTKKSGTRKVEKPPKHSYILTIAFDTTNISWILPWIELALTSWAQSSSRPSLISSIVWPFFNLR